MPPLHRTLCQERAAKRPEEGGANGWRSSTTQGFGGLKRRPTLGRDSRKGPLMKQAAPPEFAHELPPDPDGSALQCPPGTKRRALPFFELSGLSNQWNHSIPTALTAPQVKTPVQRTVIVLPIVTAEIAIQLNRS